MQTTIKKTLARQLSPFRCPGCKSRHQILLVQGEYGKKSFLCQRWLKNSSPKLKRKCLSLVDFRDRLLAVIFSQKIGLNFLIFND
ncbi:TPA: hypothetical protein ONE32_002260 [Enterobacter cloacae subsp. cloacae]|nr:hypothetical protein [Enterobacter cloacae subsp. cloacae]